MVIKTCVICKKVREGLRLHGETCGSKCSQALYYQKNKQKRKETARRWELKNPERRRVIAKKAMDKYVASGKMAKKMKEYYQRDKDNYKHKCRCRSNTNLVIKGWGSYKKIDLPKEFFRCKKCLTTENLQIHHENYNALRKQEILDAITNKEIYMLCRKCHKQLHSK